MRTIETAKSTYLKKLFSTEDEILKKILSTSRENHVDHMQISAHEGSILQFLCHAFQVKKAIEIGTLYAYSTIMIARRLPSDGELFTLDIDQKRQEIAKNLIKKDSSYSKINFLSGKALNSLKNLEKKAPFDMVFIDADKATYLDYLHWSNKHLKPGGLLIADNTFLFGSVYGEPKKDQDPKTINIIKQFNEEVVHSGIYSATVLPTQEGLTVGIKK